MRKTTIIICKFCNWFVSNIPQKEDGSFIFKSDEECCNCGKLYNDTKSFIQPYKKELEDV